LVTAIHNDNKQVAETNTSNHHMHIHQVYEGSHDKLERINHSSFNKKR